MKTESVSVGLGVTIPHPTIQFANLKGDVRYTMRMEESDSPEAWEEAQAKLRSRAEDFLGRMMAGLVKECERRHQDRDELVTMECDVRNLRRSGDTDIPF